MLGDPHKPPARKSGPGKHRLDRADRGPAVPVALLVRRLNQEPDAATGRRSSPGVA